MIHLKLIWVNCVLVQCMFVCNMSIMYHKPALILDRGKAVLDLLMTLTCSPDLPEKYGSLSKKADEEVRKGRKLKLY